MRREGLDPSGYTPQHSVSNTRSRCAECRTHRNARSEQLPAGQRWGKRLLGDELLAADTSSPLLSFLLGSSLGSSRGDVHSEQGWAMALSTGPATARQRRHLRLVLLRCTQSHTAASWGQEQRHRAQQCQPLHSRIPRSKPRALCPYQDSLHPTKPTPSSPATEISFLSPLEGLLCSWTAKKLY